MAIWIRVQARIYATPEVLLRVCNQLTIQTRVEVVVAVRVLKTELEKKKKL